MAHGRLLQVHGGLLEGLALRYGHRRLAWSVLAVAAMLGAGAPVFFVGRRPGEGYYPVDAGLLVAAELSWAGFVFLSTAVTVGVNRR